MNKSWLRKIIQDESVLTRAAVRYIGRSGPIAMLMVVRDEADIIEQTIKFHLHFGIENFIITDNGSKDGTREILAAFERSLGKAMVVIDDPEPVHNQSERVNRMIKVAKANFRPRWIISSDADEFWYPVSGRYDTEMDGKKNILTCYWHNFLPRSGTNWRDFTDIGEMPGYHSRMNKLVCAAQGLMGMYTGNHDSRSIPRISARSENIKIYHYPVRTYEQFERKVVQGHRATLKASYSSDDACIWHWKEYYKSWEQGKLPEVYENLASRNRISHDETMARLFSAVAAEALPL